MPVQPPRCPACGGELLAVALGADTPPWLCPRDSRGWWQAELDSAQFFNVHRRDYGRATEHVLAAAEEERGTAEVRGTSARPDTLPLLSDDALADLSTRQLAAGFVAQVKAEQQRRKAGKP